MTFSHWASASSGAGCMPTSSSAAARPHPHSLHNKSRARTFKNITQARILSSSSTKQHYGAILSKVLSPNAGARPHRRSLFVRLLWVAFPSRSEKELAERAHKALGVSQRQVENWLAGVNDGKASHLTDLIFIVGVEKLSQLIEGQSRK